MAIAVTKDFPCSKRIGRNLRSLSGSIAFGSSYPTGGELATAITRYFRSCSQIICEQGGGFLFVFDKVNKKIKVLHPTKAITPVGTVAAPTFTGDALATHGHVSAVVKGAETAADKTAFKGLWDGANTDIDIDVATGLTADTNLNSSTISAGTPAGTNSAPAFTGVAVAAQAGTEVPDAMDLSGLTGVKFMAMGR